MKSIIKWLPFLFILILFLFLRLNHINESFNFGTDQGLGMMETFEIYRTGKLPLIGQTGSSWNYNGRYIFFGSLPYYIYLPVFILSKWNPLSMAYLSIILQLASLIVIYYVISRYRSQHLANIFGILFSSFPVIIDHSRYLWGPNLLIPLSGFLLALLIVMKKKRSLINFFFIGLVIGMGFQINYSFLLAGFVTIFVLILRKNSLFQYLFVLSGFILGVINLILFELRHDFYNIRTILFLLSKMHSLDKSGVVNFNYHYLLPVIVFLIYIFSLLLSKINKKITWLLLTLAVSTVITVNFPVPTHGFTMVEGWNYKGVKKTEKIILSENKKGYNLVDLLTGDTRAMALRSLLILSDNPPLGITDYPTADYLFVYSKDPVEKILAGSLYELDSVRPVKLIKTWEIQNGISLYLLSRQVIK